MRRLLFWFFLLPLAVLTVLFAVANRAPVVISFDPFPSPAPAAAVTLPLFIVIFAAIIFGVLLGSLAAFARHYRLWRDARAARDEADRHKADAEAERRARAAMQPDYPSLPSPP